MSEPSSRVRVWDLPVRVFHWALAASFAGAYLLAESERWRHMHVMLGYTVLGLIAFRLVWGVVGTRYARFGSFAFSPLAAIRHLRDELAGRGRRYLGHNPAGSWAVYALLLLGVGTGITGYLTFNEVGGEAFEEVHEVLASAWLALVVLHVLGVIFSSVMQRESLVRAMWTGYKPGVAEGPESRAYRGLGVALTAAVVGFWAWNLSTPIPVAAAEDADEEHSELAEDHDSDDD
ncbi:MAG TPA: cytochrome b/b6 domain-containing protein [Steroidobacteraceae bacterium]|nr:cytochrome b/b6 domain-containing protein [Steroidobacteraceae bacterium]